MTRSPSHAAFLPTLRPDESQQHVGVKGQGTPLRYGASSNGSTASASPHISDRRGQQRRGSTPASRKPRPSNGALLPTGTRSEHPSNRMGNPSHARPENDNAFFFRLTDEELNVFRRKHRKGPLYTGFSDLAIAQELNRLGRGWDGYVRASRQAGKEGRLDESQRRRKTEHGLMSTGLPLPVGAISMQAAADAARMSGKTKPGRSKRSPGHDKAKAKGSRELSTTADELQPSLAAGLETRPVAPDLIPKTSEEDPGKLGHAGTSESDFQTRSRGRPKDSTNKTMPSSDLLDQPRPRRVESRPDYRIRRVRERRSNLPPKPPSPSPRDTYLRTQPQFTQFMCEWTDCKAMLNNIATLRKHVGIVHGQEARDTLCCSWGKCGRDDSTGVLSVFRSIEDLDEHLMACHLEPVKWHLGDGRFGKGHVVKKSSMGDTSYLFRSGKQVTPSIKDQKVETLAEWHSRKGKMKAILLKAALNASSESEDLEDDKNTDNAVL